MIVRIGLAVLAAIELVLGVWTQFFPESFYSDVPTVNLTPPFSEHLMRDFGGATIGIAIVLAAAAIWPERKLVIIALVAYLAFSLPHAVFHAGHLHGATEFEAAVLMTLLVLSVLIPLALLIVTLARRPKPATMVE